MKNICKLLLPFITGCLVSSPLHAVDDQVRTELQIVSVTPLGGDRFFYWKTEQMRGPDQQPKVRISSSLFFKPVTYRGPTTLTLLSHQGEDVYKPMAQVRLRKGSKRTIVILLPPTEGTKLPYRAIAMNGDLDKFKAATRRVVNLSQFPIRGEMGNKPFKRGDPNNVKFLCKPQEAIDAPVLNPDAKVFASQPIILEYYGAQEKWNVLSSTRWFHTPTQRHLVFVFFDTTRKNLILRGISDTVAADTRDIAANRASTETETPKDRQRRLERNKNTAPPNPRSP